MKQILAIFDILLIGVCLITTTSCTDDINQKDSQEPVKPGIYYINMDLNATLEATTKGVANNVVFDSNYDPEYIYLHKISNNEGENPPLKLPVWQCDGCENKGIRYRICIAEDGSATITPIDANGDYTNETLTLSTTDKCYFSSWENNSWNLNEDQISNQQWADEPNQSYYFYYRDKNINQEIYRSQNDFTIDELIEEDGNGELKIGRACAGFNLVGLFYDSSSGVNTGGEGEGETFYMDRDDFYDYMGSYPEEWYIKIYIGGTCFPEQYNLATQTPTNVHPNGYYSNGDAGKFESGEIDNQTFLPFSLRTYGVGDNSYTCFGYYTTRGNHLFTPVTGEDVANVYILIKHWTQASDPDGTLGNPTEEWLKNDVGALQTTMVSDTSVTPTNGNFYTLGLLMDIQQFKTAWDASRGDNWQQGTSAVSTKSPSGATVREFTLKDAKVICDVY